MVGVNPDPKLAGGETPTTLKMFAKQTRVTFPMGLDSAASYAAFPKAGAISPFPLDVIVDAEGKIAYINREYVPKEILAVIDRLVPK